MSVESDGIEESFDSQMRVVAMAAMQAGDTLARQLTEQRRAQQQATDTRRIELERRFEAERRMALAEVQQVRNTDWWNNATPQQVADTYSLARGWSEHDPEIARVEQEMRRELETRYGIDQQQEQYADPKAVQAEIERIEADRADPARRLEEGAYGRAESGRFSQEELVQHYENQAATFDRMGREADTPEIRRDFEDRAIHNRSLAETTRNMTPEEYDRATRWATPDQEEQAKAAADRAHATSFEDRADAAQNRAVSAETEAESETDPERARQLREQAAADQAEAERLRGDAGDSWDSSERREATAARMRDAGGDERLVETRMRADVSQGAPAQDAVANPPGPAAQAQTGRRVGVRGRQAQRQR